MHNIINLIFYSYFCVRHVGEYADIVWDRNFSYFCDNWRKGQFS